MDVTADALAAALHHKTYAPTFTVSDMNRELVLVGAAAAVVVAVSLAALLFPGVIAEPAVPETEADVERPGGVAVAEVTIAAEEVTGASATLAVGTYLEHRGGPVENVTVVHRATDTNTGLVEATTEIEVDPLEDEAERLVPGSITVPRESGYEIETFVYRDGSRVESASHTVEGVGTLTPAHADTDVEIHRFGGPHVPGVDLPAVEYSVASADGDRATLDVSTYLTNGGDDVEDGLELEVTARQSEANVVADATRIDVGALEPGETAAPSAEVTVPEEYDYSLDVVLWKEGTIVGSDRAAANLGPGNLTVDDAAVEDGFEVSDFEGGDRTTPEERPDAEDEEIAEGQPGFGAVGALVGALALALLAVRMRRNEP